jgi:hypothetical protein
MHKKAVVAGLLAPLVVAAEVVEAGEHPVSGLPINAFDSPTSNTLAGNPHTHFDAEDGSVPTTVNPIFASGRSNFRDVFRLRIITDPNGYRLVGYPCDMDVNKFPQMMYAFFPDIDSLVVQLSKKLGLPAVQAQAIRRAALAGGLQEIGGRARGAVYRVFGRADLEKLGMSYRPLDS